MDHDNCVLCEIEYGEEHEFTPILSRHEADGTPSSEICPGLDECQDCQDVLADAAESMDEGVYINMNRPHDLIVGTGGTYTTLED